MIAVDTAAVFDETDQRIEASKIIPLAHANLVLAGMGELDFLGYVFREIHHAVATVTFDLLAVGFEGVLDTLYSYYKLQRSFKGVSQAQFQGCEIVLVGWSPQQQRMLGMRYTMRPDGQSFTPAEIDPWCIMPAADWTAENPPAIDSVEALRRAATEQVKWTRVHRPNDAIGGLLIVCQLFKDRTDLLTAASLSDVSQ